MQLSQLVDALETIAPLRNAEPWDNVGLIAGDPVQQVNKVMLTIDYTAAVAAEVRQQRCDAVVSYHPPIFDPIKRITADSVIFGAICSGVAIYSPHTALDVAEGGTNDVLADAIGLVDRSPLRLAETKASQHKLIVFVPEKDVEKVSRALFAAGAGRIGNYSQCTFQSPGTGTFFGEDGTSPAVGQSGRSERAQEMRVETIVPIDRIETVIKALRDSHPYEEPAFDLLQLAAPPDGVGLGRIGNFPPISRQDLIARIKRELKIDRLLVAGPTEGAVTRAAVCAGACGDLLNDAICRGAQLYLTGEVRHHDAVKAAAAGMTVVCVLHSNSERAALKSLKHMLEQRLSDLPFLLSASDRDPFLIL